MRRHGYDDAFIDEAGNAVGIIGTGSAPDCHLLGHIDTFAGFPPVRLDGKNTLRPRRGRCQGTALHLRGGGESGQIGGGRRRSSSSARWKKKRPPAAAPIMPLPSTSPISASSASPRNGIASPWATRGGCCSTGVGKAACAQRRRCAQPSGTRAGLLAGINAYCDQFNHGIEFAICPA